MDQIELNQKLIDDAKYGVCSNISNLILQGANIDYQDCEGRTALYWASSWGRARVINELIKYKADTTIQDDSGETALQVAVKHDDFECTNVLIFQLISKFGRDYFQYADGKIELDIILKIKEEDKEAVGNRKINGLLTSLVQSQILQNDLLGENGEDGVFSRSL